MSGRTVAPSAIVVVAAALAFGGPARATNDAAHKMAEKFAEADGAAARNKGEERKAAEAKKREAEKAAAEKKREAQRKAEAARKALEVKRRAAAKAAEDARLAAERRQADEAEMLARARREAEEMRAGEEEVRLTEEARRLIVEAERERAKAEELLASQPEARREQAATEPERAKSAEEARLAYQRAEETRRLAEKLRRVRQIREARLTAQAVRREAEVVPLAAAPSSAEPLPGPGANASASQTMEQRAPLAPQISAPTSTAEVAPPPAMVAWPPVTAPAPPTHGIDPDPSPAKAERVAVPTSQSLPPAIAAPAATKPANEPTVRAELEPKAAVAENRAGNTPSSHPASATALPTVRLAETRFTVLVVLEPGTYGIRRNGPKVADPVLCTREGCYVSAGADQPAKFLPAHKALGIGNTWGGRAGACRQALGCVFRGIELGQMPSFLQPVDLHIFKHDRRQGHLVLADSSCRAEAGRLACRHGIYADNYIMWVIPEGLASTVGPAALQRAVTEGLNGPRSAELVPARR